MGKRRQRGGKNKKVADDEAEYVCTVEPEPPLEDQQNLQDQQPLTEPVHLEGTENVRTCTAEVSEKGVDEEEPEGDIELSGDRECENPEPKRKRQRGPTKMKDIAKDPNTRVRVEFTFMGEPYGAGSVKLSSYLGPLVREHVPVTLENWKKLSEEVKTLLWKSVQARFELDEEYQKTAVLKQMGCLWRSSKSRLVSQINEAKNNQQRMNLRPKNVDPLDWRKFVKLKTSQAFKAVSDSYKERRRKQIPHTCSRKRMVRLTEEMKNGSQDRSEVTRLRVWVKSRTKKDGTPVNTNAAEKIKKAAEMVNSDTPSAATNQGEDTLSQLLGPDNPGRMRAMGRNMSKTKLACFQVKHKCMTEMQEKQVNLQQKVNELQDEIAKMKNQRREPEVGENSAARSVNKRSHPKCVLVDWAGTDANVAGGCIISSDPEELVNDSRLGPMDVKVLVDTATVPEAFLWRPATNMFTIEEAVGQMIAWPASKCVNLEEGLQPEEIAPLGPRTTSINKCKLLDLSSDDVVVAEGRWQTKDPKALVNGLPLGPMAVKVFVDVVHQPDTFIWRPTMEKTYLEDCLRNFVAWPAIKVVFEKTTYATGQNSSNHNSDSTDQTSGGKSAATGLKYPAVGVKYAATSSKSIETSAGKGTKAASTFSKSPGEKSPASGPKSPVRKTQLASQSPVRRSPRKHGAEVIKENQKCKLMDINGMKRVVAEGRVHSTDPEQKVHFVRLGPNAARVWVDIVKVDDAAVWRPSDEIEYLKDAHGSSIAWPMDKMVIF